MLSTLSNTKDKHDPIIGIEYRYNNVMNWEGLKGREMNFE
jgi:hypothetical protein